MMNKENSMSKFQVGDLVVRTVGRWGNSRVGTEHVVRVVYPLQFEGDYNCRYDTDCYELVRRVSSSEQPTEVPTLAPKEVLQAVIDGQELQVHLGTWEDLTNPERMSLARAVDNKFRIKPSTVEVNGTEVIQPKLDNAVKYSQKCYTFAEGFQTVIEARPSFTADSKLYWDTREDAWAALRVITRILRGE